MSFNMKNWPWLFTAVLLLIIILTFLVWRLVSKEKYCCPRYNYTTLGGHPEWKLEYMKKIYPLGTNMSPEQYDNLEMYYTALLPSEEQERLKNIAYTAILPGPGCWEMPCKCDGDVPDVRFAPDPILQNKWPPCNVPGADGAKCCESPEAYKKCLRDGTISMGGTDKPNTVAHWSSNDTWDGNEINATQDPPDYGQVWKPTLWPKYTLAVNKYPPKNWNSFYNFAGDPSDSWVEGVHSAFSINIKTAAVWFYRAKGSGIFVNLGKTMAVLNKIDGIVKMMSKLGVADPLTELARFIMRKYNGPVLTLHDDDSVTYIEPSNTGLEFGVEYWLNGQVARELYDELKTYKKAVDPTTNLKMLLEEAIYGHDYNINRINNTGALDPLIVYLAKKLKLDSLQFTVQPNVYTSWTTEIMILGSGNNVYDNIHMIPKNKFRILDPNNLPTGPTNQGMPCDLGTNINTFTSCVYCKGLPASLNSFSNCTQDVTNWPDNCGNKPPHPNPTPYNELGQAHGGLTTQVPVHLRRKFSTHL